MHRSAATRDACAAALAAVEAAGRALLRAHDPRAGGHARCGRAGRGVTARRGHAVAVGHALGRGRGGRAVVAYVAHLGAARVHGGGLLAAGARRGRGLEHAARLNARGRRRTGVRRLRAGLGVSASGRASKERDEQPRGHRGVLHRVRATHRPCRMESPHAARATRPSSSHRGLPTRRSTGHATSASSGHARKR